MPKRLLERATLTEKVNKTGKILVDILTPGVGSSGYYSPEVCEAAAGLVQPGTQMYLDHPTDLESMERPGRSVKDIAAVFTQESYWDPNRGEAGALVAEAQVVPAWIETMDVIQGAIGVSIRGSATDIVEGERPDGSVGKVVEGLQVIDSVDFVTRAGRGGSFALMESAAPSRVHARAINHGVSEATVNDTREALQTVLRDLYSGEKTYVWVRDFDDTTVWFEIEAPEDTGIYAQTYTQDDAGAVALDGDRSEVRVRTEYVPVTRPDSTTTTTEADLEVTMGKIQIEESDHTALTEKAGRADTLESENTDLKRENAELRASEGAVTKARSLVVEANKELPAATVERIVAAATVSIPLTESGELDEPALTKAVETARTAEEAYLAGLAEAAGAGQITGFGTPPGTQVVEAATPTTTPWGRPIKQEA